MNSLFYGNHNVPFSCFRYYAVTNRKVNKFYEKKEKKTAAYIIRNYAAAKDLPEVMHVKHKVSKKNVYSLCQDKVRMLFFITSKFIIL